LSARAVVALAALGPALAAACGGNGADVRTPTSSASASASAPPPASVLPPPTATAKAVSPASTAADAPGARWIKSIPSRPVTVHVDELVWAAVPTDDEVKMGVYRVLAVMGNVAALQDLLRVKWEHVPGALIYPVTDPARLTPDMLVTYADWRGWVGAGRIVRTQPKVRVTFRDSSAVVRDETVNVAEPLVGTVAPLQFVSFAHEGVEHKGLVFLVDGDSVFVRDDTGRAHVVTSSSVSPIKMPSKKLKVGDAVRAYSSDKGYRAGAVTKVLLTGLSYGVTCDGETRTYFFTDLALPK
jgi:hypothetical protein